MKGRGRIGTLAWIGAALLMVSCAPRRGLLAAPSSVALRLATTTSTYDSGLLTWLLPDFEASAGARVQVIAVGTGQALELGKRGDVDVVLVHSERLELAFVAEGYGRQRQRVMFNDFIVVGPKDDPAAVVAASDAAEALRRIHAAGARFVSRADDSGTYARELVLWEAAGLTPTLLDAWYMPIGQGMAETLRFADEKSAYTLSDRGTYLGLAEDLTGLTILLGGATVADNPDPALLNPYAVILVSAGERPPERARLAEAFAAWLTSPETQSRIAEFGLDTVGQALFYPASSAWCAEHGPGNPGCADG